MTTKPVSSWRLARAKKTHGCDYCNNIIAPGQYYMYRYNISQYTYEVNLRACLSCMAKYQPEHVMKGGDN
jgi:RNase P subunit RPR2